MKRIAYLVEYGTICGAENSLLELLKNLDRKVFDPIVFAPYQGEFLKKIRDLSIPIIYLDMHKVPLLSNSLIKRHDIDLLHANSLSMAVKTGEIASQLSIPTIGHIRDIMKLTRKKISSLNKHRCLIAVSSAVKNYYVRLGISVEKVICIHNGVDTGVFDPGRMNNSVLHKEFGLSPDHFLIGCIGQICLRKAQDVFLAAAQRIASLFPQSRFFIIGKRFSTKNESYFYEKKLKKISEKAVLSNRCFFLGFRDTIPEVLYSLDCLIHVPHQEPCSRVLLEASSMAKPIIASNVGGTREIVCDNKTGFLVTDGDVAGIIEKIQTLMDNKELGLHLGLQARRTIQKKFSSPETTKKIEELYKTLLLMN
ncbi:glycosyltransferase family 4 protein [Chlamydiota bacterium]